MIKNILSYFKIIISEVKNYFKRDVCVSYDNGGKRIFITIQHRREIGDLRVYDIENLVEIVNSLIELKKNTSLKLTQRYSIGYDTFTIPKWAIEDLRYKLMEVYFENKKEIDDWLKNEGD